MSHLLCANISGQVLASCLKKQSCTQAFLSNLRSHACIPTRNTQYDKLVSWLVDSGAEFSDLEIKSYQEVVLGARRGHAEMFGSLVE